jgi:hypothetical protein
MLGLTLWQVIFLLFTLICTPSNFYVVYYKTKFPGERIDTTENICSILTLLSACTWFAYAISIESWVVIIWTGMNLQHQFAIRFLKILQWYNGTLDYDKLKKYSMFLNFVSNSDHY